jgi:hypothetical protein
MKFKKIIHILSIFSIVLSQSWEPCGNVVNPTGYYSCSAFNTVKKTCCRVGNQLNSGSAGCYFFPNDQIYSNLGAELVLGNGNQVIIDCGEVYSNSSPKEFFGVPYCNQNSNFEGCFNSARANYPCCYVSGTYISGPYTNQTFSQCLQTKADFTNTTLGRTFFKSANAVVNCTDTQQLTHGIFNLSSSFLTLNSLAVLILLTFLF